MNTRKLKFIRGYNFSYAVTYDGKVCSRRKYPEWKQIGSKKPDGYMTCVLIVKNYQEQHARFIHRLIATAFVPNPLNLPEVNHLDRNRSNNHAENLEWCTHQQNIQHSYDNGRKMPKGKDHWGFGKKASNHTKKLQSQAKIGVNHPKFKGWYVIDGKKYTSTQEIETKTGMCGRTAVRKCHAKVKGYSFKPK